MRINKYLANRGIASRRSIDKMIEEGRVRINGKVATLGQLVDPQKDNILVDGREVQTRGEEKVYIILNKPAGYTSTVAKIKGEKNVLELVYPKSHPELDSGSRFRNPSASLRASQFGMTGTRFPRLYPVGRLDRDSTGLLLLTNDGELAQKLTHPKFHMPKTYEVKVLGNVSNTQLEMIRKGIKLEEGITKPADVKIKHQSLPHHSILEITLYEGKKRQIRRMLATLHLHVLEIKRTSIGPIKLGSLGDGKYRNLTQEEIKKLKGHSEPNGEESNSDPSLRSG